MGAGGGGRPVCLHAGHAHASAALGRDPRGWWPCLTSRWFPRLTETRALSPQAAERWGPGQMQLPRPTPKRLLSAQNAE